MKEIPLTQGKVATIDDEDYERVMQHRWYADHSRHAWYARTNIRNADGTWSSLKMHRLICGAQPRVIIDHIDRNGLNNTRANLRIATPSQNAQNKQYTARKKSKYKGVQYEPACRLRPWIVRVKIDGKQRKIGCYATQEEAARAYNAVAAEHFGEFACLNKIHDSSPV